MKANTQRKAHASQGGKNRNQQKEMIPGHQKLALNKSISSQNSYDVQENEEFKTKRRTNKYGLPMEDPEYMRNKLDNAIKRMGENSDLRSIDVIDELYQEGREAVNHEIDQVDDLFLMTAVKKGKKADQIELENLLHERDEWDKTAAIQRYITATKKDQKSELLAQMKHNQREQSAGKQRKIQAMIDATEGPCATKKKLLNKSLYEMANDLQNYSMAPSVDSYGGSGVYLRYKQNRWFENVNIIALKQLKQHQEKEALLELLHLEKKHEREKQRKEIEKKKEA